MSIASDPFRIVHGFDRYRPLGAKISGFGSSRKSLILKIELRLGLQVMTGRHPERI